ncbi:MAG: hypothetical protein AA931_11320 [Peptococcaceae bacterium 1109]|nr:MAG: hypothetical protein AA931_11320 [Peptococcaceae bacterium 1109]
MTVSILGAVLAGLICGRFFISAELLPFLENSAEWLLAAMLFVVGIDLGKNKDLVRQIKALPKAALAVPFLIAFGSIGGALLVNILLGLRPLEAAAVASGFGWYSLSGVLIAENYDVGLGALAFLTNVFREIIAILITPHVAGRLGHLPAVAPGGATTMDVTLPTISKHTSPQVTLVAFYSGVTLTLLVPVIIPLILYWAASV